MSNKREKIMIEKVWKVYIRITQQDYLGLSGMLKNEQELLKEIICEYYGADKEDFNLFENLYVFRFADKFYEDIIYRKMPIKEYLEMIKNGYDNIKSGFEIKLEMENNKD